MSLLEDRYRLAIRVLLPRSYRAGREEEMVDAFMEGAGEAADEPDARPRWPEIASLAGLGLRVRMGGAGASPRYVALGEAVRQVAVLGLFFHATIGVAVAVGFLWTTPSPYTVQGLARGLDSLLWAAAFLALTRGSTRAARGLAVAAAVLATAVTLPVDPLGAVLNVPLAAVPVLALWAGFHRAAPRPDLPGWLAALPVGAGLALGALLLVAGAASLAPKIDLRVWSFVWPWLAPSGLACLGLLAASAVHLAARRSPFRPWALAILAVPVLVARLHPLLFQGVDPITRTMAVVQIGQFAALAVCAALFTVLALRAVPREAPLVR
ncbi:hypothetical protein [Spongiactinospora sp. TRM90649]|uniref:hypothetical protein n=1 Tax=Spongiactinospora sp. TRM90649 TaxID=3031114 RepID=UPI0023F61BC2|nr:hypothetical protein [Spongiactinospora sp. TRM90649]MDF5753232.1 hypothetical protein [Spongiactinospora sp. TRM90649]